MAPRKLWTLALEAQTLDPEEVAEAIADQVERGDLDFRSRLLIRDALAALESRWSPRQVELWMNGTRVADRLKEIRKEQLEGTGFPSLSVRLMEPTRRSTIETFLRELGLLVNHPARLVIGGSIALMLAGFLERRTEDVDVVDEVPAELRSQATSLERLAARYGLQLTHFQSHYLPSGWEQRLHSQGTYGRLQVWRVDSLDVLLSKLFSSREKDRDDLRAVAPRFEKDDLTRRLLETCGAFVEEPRLRKMAEDNWYVLFGAPLP